MQLLFQQVHLFNVRKIHFMCCWLLAVFSALSSYAQLQENNWFFGFGNHVEFQAGVPVVSPMNDFYATEGSATISTADGDLRFYTDGLRVYDRFGNLMTGSNVLYGSDSSTQNALIIPFPGDTEERFYYVFTVPAQVNFYQNFSHSGLEYVVVDMAQNGGLGSVVQASQELLPMIEEKIHATWHTNNRDVWLVVHSAESNAFYSFLINCEGIQDPVVSETGQGRTQGLDFGSARGTLKLSPNSERIAVVHSNLTEDGYLDEAVIEVGSFNATNGNIVIEDEKVLGPNFMHESYSCEFSPNSNVLYWSVLGGGTLRQFDLLAPDFAASMVELGAAFGEYWASLTLGPDGRIYGARSNGNPFLGVVEFPDVVGTGCDMDVEGVPLQALNSLGISNCWMFPFPEQVIPEDETVDRTLCEGEEIVLSAEDLPGEYLWSTGETTSSILISAGGEYEVQINDGCFEFLRTFFVMEIEKPTLNLSQSQEFSCEGDTLFVTVETSALEWEWLNGTQQVDTFFVSQTETIITLFDDVCLWEEPFTFTFQQRPEAPIEETYSFCENTTFQLPIIEEEGTTFLWSDGETDTLFETEIEGAHWLEITNSCGTERIDFDLITTFCSCEVFIPNAFTPDLNDLNEIFRPVSECPFTEYSFTIFNRWGEVVFSSTLPEAAWNGSVRGGAYYVNEGVYTYVLRYGLPNGNREEVYGSVVVLR